MDALYPLALALAWWGLIACLDANVKASYIVRMERENRPWDAVPFMADRGLFCWRSVLGALALLHIILVRLYTGGWYASASFASLFPLEHFLYWQWVVLLDIPQKQQFKGQWRRPRLGESPDNPSWLKIGPLSLVWLHKRWVLLLLLALNVAGVFVFGGQ